MLELEAISRIESRQSLWFPCQDTLGTGTLRYLYKTAKIYLKKRFLTWETNIIHSFWIGTSETGTLTSSQ